jgi:Zn-dependent protease
MYYLVAFFVLLLLSAVWHEYLHASVADQLGDPTPRDLGRLTLNPAAHIDPFMTLLLPLVLFVGTGGQFMFAAAKPVPFNPYNLRLAKYGPALVGVAGPAGNLALAAALGLAVRTLALPPDFAALLALGVWANVLLAVFNLVPIPPLDGAHVLTSLLPPHLDHVARFLERYGWLLFLVFLLFFSALIRPVMVLTAAFFLGADGLVALADALGQMHP